MSRRAIFLDKDGTLIRNVPYNVDPNKIELMPGSPALKRLIAAGYCLVLITNQAGVAHGFFDESALAGVRRRIEFLLAAHNVELDGFYYCPHHPEARRPGYRRYCNCRKPNPGLMLQAAEELNVDLHHSWFVGDILDDIEAGNRAGCRTVFVDVGSETEWKITADRLPDYQVNNLQAAVDRILDAPVEAEAAANFPLAQPRRS